MNLPHWDRSRGPSVIRQAARIDCRILTLAVAILISATAVAQDRATRPANETSQGTRDDKASKGKERKTTLAPGDVDLSKSRVFVRVDKKGLGHDHGIVGRIKSGHVELRGKKPGELVFDMQSFVADTPDARKVVKLAGEIDADTRKKVTQTMLSSSVLDVENHPTATLEITSVAPAKPPEGEQSKDATHWFIRGEFTLHGTTQPIRVPAVADEVEGYTRLRGKFSIRQTDYGIKPFTKALGAVGVADELTIWGDLWIQVTDQGSTR